MTASPAQAADAGGTPPLILSLVGMPGCGKSTVGRHLARHLNQRFADSDSEIEKRIGMPIRDWFPLHGEDAFREVVDTLRKLKLFHSTLPQKKQA